MLFTKIQLKSFLGFGDENLIPLLYMGMVAILLSGAEPFEQIANTLSTECPMRNLMKIAPEVLVKTFENKMATVVTILDFQSAQSFPQPKEASYEIKSKRFSSFTGEDV